MSRNDIAEMSVEERIALMEELWVSFERDDLEYPMPKWHEDVLDQRANRTDENFISFDKVKHHIKSQLDAYRDS